MIDHPLCLVVGLPIAETRLLSSKLGRAAPLQFGNIFPVIAPASVAQLSLECLADLDPF